jgi:hypothetical protein
MRFLNIIEQIAKSNLFTLDLNYQNVIVISTSIIFIAKKQEILKEKDINVKKHYILCPVKVNARKKNL